MFTEFTRAVTNGLCFNPGFENWWWWRIFLFRLEHYQAQSNFSVLKETEKIFLIHWMLSPKGSNIFYCWYEFVSIYGNFLYLQSFTVYLGLSLLFVWNSALREKFNFYFLRAFLLVLTKFLFDNSRGNSCIPCI